MNANVILSLSLVVVGACVGIFVWMQANGETADSISFVDACYETFADDAERTEDCTAIAEAGITWDTPIACSGRDDVWLGAWTLRGYWEATATDGDTALAESNLEQYWAATCSTVSEGDRGDSRKLWGSFGGWVESLVAPTAKSALTLFREATGTMINFEGICSGDMDFAFMGGDDTAECSGKNDRSSHPSGGKSCEAYMTAGNSKNYYGWAKKLGKGCIDHDMCLQKGGGHCGGNCESQGCHTQGYHNKGDHPGGKSNCDVHLAATARSCSVPGNTGGSNMWHCIQVAVSIGTGPNWEHCGY
jgi:hypothetical protein